MEIKYATDNTREDIESILGKEYSLRPESLDINSTFLRLAATALLVAFGLPRS